MNEEAWLAGIDPSPLLEYLRGRVSDIDMWELPDEPSLASAQNVRSIVSDRKLILFAAACCRHIWPLLDDQRCRGAVEIAERFADGRADVKELYAARTPTIAAEREVGPAARAAYYTANARPADTVWHVHTAAAEAETRVATRAVTRDWDTAWNAAYSVALQAQTDLLRDVMGNPFQRIAVNPAWITWASGTVQRIARRIYDDHRFDELPVLADALEDAGCDDEQLLTHCRSGETHVRGCWAVDLLLSLFVRTLMRFNSTIQVL